MALHVRYTDGRHNDTRIQVNFTRLDLLWQTHEPLTSPFTGHTLAGLPVLVEDNLVVGPTILDMMMRTVYPIAKLPKEVRSRLPDGATGAAVWTRRNLATLWRDPSEATPLHTNLSGLISANSSGEIHHPLQANPDSFDAWFTITFTAKETAEAGDEAHHRV